MMKKITIVLAAGLLAIGTPSCNSNKIACPTYADSFPEKQGKKKKKPEPPMPKPSKVKSGVLPPGYGGKKKPN